jgi:thiamine biosynthesis lipoprotein
MAQKRSRREFLTGKAASEHSAAADGAPSLPGAERRRSESSLEGSAGQSSYLLHISRSAMACTFEWMFNAGQYPDAAEKGLESLDLVDVVEEQMSFFRPTSEISRINCLAADGPLPVEPRLFELLQWCVGLHAETGGAFDVTAAPLWEVWGFARRAGRLPSEQELDVARRSVGGHLLELDPRRRTIFFRSPGVRLSLGSVGKGYALDRAAELLAESGMGDFLLHGGYSSILARGARMDGRASNESAAATQRRRDGWSVGLRDPLRPDRRLGEVRLCDRALGTSGSTIQFFRHEGRRHGHILDPRTGLPADEVLSTTVLAPTAALADALSTALFVMGPAQGIEYCRNHQEIAAILICPKGSRNDYDVHAIGFRPGELELRAKAIVHGSS